MAGPTVQGGGQVVGPSAAELIQNSLKQQNDMMAEMARSMQIYRDLNDKRRHTEFVDTFEILKNIANQTYKGDIQAVFDATPGLGERLLRKAGFSSVEAKRLAKEISSLPASENGWEAIYERSVLHPESPPQETIQEVIQQGREVSLTTTSQSTGEAKPTSSTSSTTTPQPPVFTPPVAKGPPDPGGFSPLETETAYTPQTKGRLPVVSGGQQGGLAGTATDSQEALQRFAPSGTVPVGGQLQGGLNPTERSALYGGGDGYAASTATAPPAPSPSSPSSTSIPSPTEATDEEIASFNAWMKNRVRTWNTENHPPKLLRKQIELDDRGWKLKEYWNEFQSSKPVAPSTPIRREVSAVTETSPPVPRSTGQYEGQPAQMSMEEVGRRFNAAWDRRKAGEMVAPTPAARKMSQLAEEGVKQAASAVSVLTSPTSTPSDINQARRNIRQAVGTLDRFMTWADLKKLNPQDLKAEWRYRMANDPAFQDVVSRIASSPESVARFQEAAQTAREKTLKEIEREIQLAKVPSEVLKLQYEIKYLDYKMAELGFQEDELTFKQDELELKKSQQELGKTISSVLSEPQMQMVKEGMEGMLKIMKEVGDQTGKFVTPEVLKSVPQLYESYKLMRQMVNKGLEGTGLQFPEGEFTPPSFWANLWAGLFGGQAVGTYKEGGISPVVTNEKADTKETRETTPTPKSPQEKALDNTFGLP
jgi:hypothetical protein